MPLIMRVPATLAVLACTGLLCVAVSAQSAAAGTYYCNQYNVPGYTECSQHLNTYEWNYNQAYAYHGDGIPVCERATVIDHAANASHRCGSSPVNSGCDLTSLYYAPGTGFSMYADNNDFSNVIMVGEGFEGDECA